MLTILLIIFIIVNFILLTKGVFNVPTGMLLTAGLGLILLSPEEAKVLLIAGFEDFAVIATLFTAVAVPAHILERSEALDHVGMRIGEFIGKSLQHSKTKTLLITAVCLSMTYIMAALFHNTTSILVTASIIAVICKSYRIPVIPMLGGALIASNLGGFSTRWGDTPNIVEAHTWELSYGIFFKEILPINLGLLGVLILYISALIKFWERKAVTSLSFVKNALSMVEFRSRRRNTRVDKYLMWVGITGLAVAVVGPLFFPSYEIILSIVALIVSVLFDKRDHRSETLFVLGIETYATLLAIFIIAKVMAESTIGIGSQIEALVIHNNASIWVILLASYVGTLFTEAASWATAAAPIIHSIDSTTRSAWALGAGICAGSSSIITAATAGIILLKETAQNEAEARITFRNYLGIGLSFSALMLIYYVIVLTIFL